VFKHDDFTVGPVCCRQELSADKAVSEAELQRTLGTLRYLKGLQAAHARAVAAQGPSPSTPLLSGQGTRVDGILSHLGVIRPWLMHCPKGILTCAQGGCC
jgi:hypothetical protein